MTPKCPQCRRRMSPAGQLAGGGTFYGCTPCSIEALPVQPAAAPAVRPYRLRLSLVQRIVGAIEAAPWPLSRSDLVTILNADGFASDSSIRHAVGRMLKRGQLEIAADGGRPASAEECYRLPRVKPNGPDPSA